jgi:hypothetical protein
MTQSRLQAVAVTSIFVLLGAGWLFFLATFELSKVNYERKRAKTAATRVHPTGPHRQPQVPAETAQEH